MIPYWVLGASNAALVFAGVLGAYAWGEYLRRCYVGEQDGVRPVYDWRNWRMRGRPVIVLAHSDKHDVWLSPDGEGRVKFHRKRFFGDEPDWMGVDDYVETGRIIHRGRKDFEALFGLQVGVLRSELEHERLLKDRYQHLSELQRHDPDALMDKNIEVAKKITQMAPVMMQNKQSKPGVRK